MFRITEDPSCLSTFKYFIILILSTYYILCISWIIKCLIIIDARCKHEDLRAMNLSSSLSSEFTVSSAHFWAIMQRIEVISYRSFGTNSRSRSVGSELSLLPRKTCVEVAGRRTYKSVFGRSSDRSSRHKFFLVSLCLKANAEMVPNIPCCHYMLLM